MFHLLTTPRRLQQTLSERRFSGEGSAASVRLKTKRKSYYAGNIFRFISNETEMVIRAGRKPFVLHVTFGWRFGLNEWTKKPVETELFIGSWEWHLSHVLYSNEHPELLLIKITPVSWSLALPSFLPSFLSSLLPTTNPRGLKSSSPNVSNISGHQ